MKNFWLLFIFLIPAISYSQDNKYYDFLEELYFERQASPRAEAMGTGLAADNQNDFGALYNPALTSLEQGLKVNVSSSDKPRDYRNGDYSSYNVSYNLKNIGSFGFSRYSFKFNETYYYGSGYLTGENLRHTIYTVNYSREIFKDFFAGININRVTPNALSPGGLVNESEYPIDIGLLKRFVISDSANKISHIVQLAGSLYNLNNVVYKYTHPSGYTDEYSLPTMARVAASFNAVFHNNKFIKELNLFSLFFHVEYENTLNSMLRQNLKAGAEIAIMDILFFRAGALSFDDANENYWYEDYSYSKRGGLSYGGGVKIPLNLIFKLKTPASIGVDYAKLKLDKYGSRHFESIAVKLNYVPNF